MLIMLFSLKTKKNKDFCNELTIKSAIARCVSITSRRLGVRNLLLINVTSTVMLPIAEITIKILEIENG